MSKKETKTDLVVRRTEQSDAVPCPACGSTDLDFFANVVCCIECDHHGPRQAGPEFACDWRTAIDDWNRAATAPPALIFIRVKASDRIPCPICRDASGECTCFGDADA